MILSLMGENDSGSAPSIEDLESWVNSYGMDHPVVSDSGFGVTVRYIAGTSIELPSMHLIGPGAEVLGTEEYYTRSQIESLLP